MLATAAASVSAAILISASEIFQHLATYARPALQKQIIRVLLMVPIYALCSFFSLAFPAAGPYLDTVRELYEALTVYAFTWYLLCYLELDANLSFASFGEILASKPPMPHMWPLHRVLAPWQMGTPFIHAVQARAFAPAPAQHACLHDAHAAALRVAATDTAADKTLLTHRTVCNTQTGVLNYVVLRPITAVFALTLTPFGYYKAGNVDPRNVRRVAT